jgi:diadenosine tetraphosphate (Ap4A) HIT family hydrolase
MIVPPDSSPPQCLSCLGLAGTPRVSPGPPIYVGRHWQVEHAYPSKMVGWLVIVLRRHAIALHELSSEEFMELGTVLELTVRALHEKLGSAKEYAACYAEAKGFEHIHFHVVPRAHDMPEELLGAGSFELLRVSRAEAADPAAVRVFCESLQNAFPV